MYNNLFNEVFVKHSFKAFLGGGKVRDAVKVSPAIKLLSAFLPVKLTCYDRI